MKQHIMTAAGIFALGIALTSTSASATDWKAYTGSECKSYYGSQAGDFTTGHLSIRNNTSTKRYVICPLINDNGTMANNLRITYYSPSGTTYCMIVNMDYYGYLQSYTGASGVSNGYHTSMYFKTGVGTNTHSQTLWCELPGKGELFGYRTNW